MSHIHPQARTALLQKQISLLRKSISRKNLAQYEAHDCCARVEFWKECRFMQQSQPEPRRAGHRAPPVPVTQSRGLHMAHGSSDPMAASARSSA